MTLIPDPGALGNARVRKDPNAPRPLFEVVGEFWYDDEGPCCNICDGLGHGYPGGPPCPLEQADYSGEPWWAQ